MQMKTKTLLLVGLFGQVALACSIWQSHALAGNSPYSRMAPLDQYLMPENAEIALARSAAPRAISAGAEVMVLGQAGYTTAVRGRNGFVCMVARSWGAATGNPEFWNVKVRGPLCFNPPAASTAMPIYLMKTKLVLAGKSKAEIVRAIASAFETKELPPVAPDAMSYMMSKQQYLSDQDRNWHPHLMFFAAENTAGSWGANLPGSPVLATDAPQGRMTVLFVWVGSWSDGTAAPRATH